MSDKKSLSKRKASDIRVPQPGEDGAERKRVLNVLAQRRYRQRRKEHVQKLESRAAKDQPWQPLLDTATTTTSQAEDTASMQQTFFEQSTVEAPLDFSMDASNGGHSLTSPSNLFASFDTDPFAIATDGHCFWDTSVLLPSLPSTPLSTSKHSSSNESETWSLTSLAAAKSPNDRPITPPPLPTLDTQYSFPDEANLNVLEMTLLRGCMMVARRMNVADTMWSLNAISPFINPSFELAQFNHLPANLQPTLLQMSVPHHPVIDLLPWPSARDSMIRVLQQPPEFRPPGAASPTALLEFVYDIEDSAEGVRISGNDPTSEQNWEVGEKVFKSWWWMFNKDIIKRSNELRASRGAPMLGSGSILGEVV